jgi:hypothetical protein
LPDTLAPRIKLDDKRESNRQWQARLTVEEGGDTRGVARPRLASAPATAQHGDVFSQKGDGGIRQDRLASNNFNRAAEVAARIG